MEVYIQTDLSLDALATELREVLNLPAKNRSEHQRHQARHGVNLGGSYYLFEVLGCTFTLVANHGEVEIPEMTNFQYYLVVESGSDEGMDRAVAAQISATLANAGLVSAVESLSY